METSIVTDAVVTYTSSQRSQSIGGSSRQMELAQSFPVPVHFFCNFVDRADQYFSNMDLTLAQ